MDKQAIYWPRTSPNGKGTGMKTLLTLLLTLSINAHAVDWNEEPYDKVAHISLGTTLSCLVTTQTDNMWYGFLSAFAVGLIKESTDKNFDTGDLASWGVGGAIGSLCIKF